MRKLMILLLMLIPLSFISAADEEVQADAPNVLNIRAYKTGPEDYLKIVITDALYESLAIIQGGEVIDLSPHLEMLLSSDIDKPQSDTFPERVVFSYRIVGNTAGTYEIALTVSPLRSDESGDMIPARYDLGNLSYVFPAAASSSYNGATISSISSSKEIIVRTGEDTLSSRWKVEQSTSSVVPEWVHRGAVAMMVDSNVYRGSEVSTDEYLAEVKVELKCIE